MRLLVTGGAGFVGSVVTAALLAAGHEVVVLDDLSAGHADAVPDGARLVEGDLGDAGRVLAQAGAGAGPVDGVLHLAALALVGESVAQPGRYWRTNLGGTLSLLEAVREAGVERFVFSSTCAVYGAPESVPISEDEPTAPVTPYGASKLAVDHLLDGWCAAHGLGAVSLRYFNVAGAAYGCRERHAVETHLIPLALQVASGQREHLVLHGTDYPTPDGTCVRDYIHVADLADAHLRALSAARPGQHHVLNLGTGTGYSVQEVVEATRKVTGHPVPAVAGPRREGDPPVLVADGSRARAALGWEPRRTDLRTIVRDAWEARTTGA